MNAQCVRPHINDVAIPGRYAAFRRKSRGLCRDNRKFRVHGPRLRSGHQPAVGLVGPINKCFRNKPEPVALGRVLQLRAGHTDECRPAWRFGDDPRDDISQFAVVTGVVVQRTVRLHMRQPGAKLGSNISEIGHLRCKRAIQRVTAQKAACPAEAITVRIAGVCADGHTVGDRRTDRFRHRVGVAGMPAASNVAARHYREQRRIVRVALAQVRIEIDRRHNQPPPLSL